MNAIPLYIRKDDGTFVPSDMVFYCVQCRHIIPYKPAADQCCVCTICQQPIGDKPWYGGQTHKQHQSCYHRQEAKRHDDLLECAEVVAAWDGYVFDYESNRIFSGIDEFMEYLEEQDDNPLHCWPDRVFLCKEEHPDQRGVIGLDNLIENMMEQWGYDDQDARDFVQNTLTGYDALAAAVAAFNAANTGLTYIVPDTARCMLVPKDEIAARDAAMDAGKPEDEQTCVKCRESGVTPDSCSATHCHYYERVVAPKGAAE